MLEKEDCPLFSYLLDIIIGQSKLIIQDLKHFTLSYV